MRLTMLLPGAGLFMILGLQLGFMLPTATQDQKAAASGKANQVPTKTGSDITSTRDGAPRSDSQTPVASGVWPELTANEAALVETSAAFLKAYCATDATAVAAHFAIEAEYVDENGDVLEGRQAIEDSLTAFFAENPDCTLEIDIGSLRFVSPNLAIEDGISTVTLREDAPSIQLRYTTVYSKIDDKWLIASIRDQHSKDLRQHSLQLEQLDWLLGDWIDEGDDAVVAFSCDKSEDGNFLIRAFTIQIAGQESLSGTQRIGWDPLTGKLRMWIFDSEGGFSEGFWNRKGDDWVLKLNGVTADGEPASMTGIYSGITSHSMTWQSIDLEIAGVQLPDSEMITVVRTAPTPELTEAP